jgi:hypothetical protein
MSGFVVRESGLAVPAEPSSEPAKRRVFSIDVFYQENVLTCLRTIDREGAWLMHVVQLRSGMPFDRAWRIMYSHTEELSIEVLC